MEKISITEEKDHTRITVTPVSEASLIVKIGSISIDLGKAMNKQVTEECHHFSLREYVSDMRNKNVRIGAPFAGDGDDEITLREQLVPLHVPKFRLWDCQSCVQDICVANSSGSQQIIEKASPSFITCEIHPSPSNKEKVNDLMGLAAVCGQENGMKDDSNQKIAPCPVLERRTNGTEPASDVAAVVLAIECQKAGTSVKDAGAMKQPSVEFQECDNGLKKCNQKLNGDIHLTKEHESTASLRHRKKRMRFLSDLPDENGEERSDRLASNTAMPNETAAPASTSAQRRRKITQKPSGERKLPKKKAKKEVRASKGDAKTRIAVIHISDSESEDDASAGTGFRSHMPLQQTGNGPSSSKLKRKMSHGEDRQNSYKRKPRGSFKGDIGLDLSLTNSYMEVDKINTLNNGGRMIEGSCIGQSSATDLAFSKDIAEDISGKIAYSTDNMLQPEKSHSLYKKLDLSLGCCKKKATEPERFPEASRNNSDRRSETVFEQRSCDDIPMEIVELGAKHKYERGLPEAERNSCLAKRINEPNYEMMGISDVHGNRVRPLHKEHNKWNPVDLSNANSNHFVVGNRDESHVLPLFAQTSAPRTFINNDTQNCLWSGDKLVHKSSPTDTQVFDTYNTAHDGPQHNGMAGNIWVCGASCRVPSKPNFPEKIESGTSYMATYLPSPDLHKGKRVRDLDLNRAAPDDSDLGVLLECPFVANNTGRDLNRKENESLHSFSNEAMPAMQLLSLMDAGMQSRDPYNADVKKLCERPFFHPNLGMDERANLFEKPPFPQNHQVKEYSGSGPAMYQSSRGTRHMSSAYYGPGIVTSQLPEKAKKTYLPQQNRDWRSRTPVCAGGIPDMIRDWNPYQDKQKGILGDPYQDKQKGILGASADVVFPSQRDALKITENRKDVGSSHIHGTITPLRDISKEEVCIVNRNPADFTFPEEDNMYMICGGDLKFNKDISRSRSVGFEPLMDAGEMGYQN